MSDDVSILFVQDILMLAVLARYAHVMWVTLLTDDGPEQLAFYGPLGFQNTRNIGLNALHRANMQTGA